MTPEQIEAVMGNPSVELAFLRGANAAFIEEIERLKAENEQLKASKADVSEPSKDFKKRINTLAEFDAKATPGEWFFEVGFVDDMYYAREKGKFVTSASKSKDDARLICVLRNETLPLLKEMDAEIDRLNERLETVGELRCEVEEERDLLAVHGEKLINEMGKIAGYARELKAKNRDLCARIVKASEIITKARASIPVDHDWRNEWDFYMKDAFNVLSSDLFDHVEGGKDGDVPAEDSEVT